MPQERDMSLESYAHGEKDEIPLILDKTIWRCGLTAQAGKDWTLRLSFSPPQGF